VQVADRWHLMENASAAFLGAIKQSMQKIRKAFGTGVVDPALLTSAERRQYNGWIQREDKNAAVLALAKAGVPINGNRPTHQQIPWHRPPDRSGRADRRVPQVNPAPP
jgi:hypothetical protein